VTPIGGTSPGSPAERAGILKGDLLPTIGDGELESIYDFTYALQLYKPGDVVLVKFRRDNSDQESRVTLGTRGAH
jgi:serine protease Do